MRSYGLIFPEAGVADIDDIEVPDPGPGQVLIEARSLISPGTEGARLIGRSPLGQFPLRPGYSFAGRVLKIGAGVIDYKESDRVVANAGHAAHALVQVDRPFITLEAR